MLKASEGFNSATGEAEGSATQVDQIFGSNSQLLAIVEVHAASAAKETFARTS